MIIRHRSRMARLHGLGHRLRRPLGDSRRLLHVLGWWRMEGHHGIVRSLPRHSIPAPIRLRRQVSGRTRHRWLIAAGVGQVRRPNLRAAMMRPHGWIGRRLALHRGRPIIRDKRLGLGVECMAVVTSRDRMLALRVVRVCICRKLPILVRDPHRTRAHLPGV